ncbi:PQQ-binding-like beta-propeller repeat protein [Candidatus Dojkabacteria bacterium]|nr:PQQ-binding-like beta-propeller repeat protein [Candidatus Dojkabacteria bacterium]
MKIKKKYFVGKNRPGTWASVYAYKPSDSGVLAKRGEIFAAVLLEGPEDFESSIAGNLLLDILHETYFESTKKSTLEALEEAVRAVKNRLISLVENDDSAAISGINFDLVTMVVKGDYFYSVRIGDGVLKIYRSGNLQDLSAGYKDPTGVGDFEVLSSFKKKGDVMFLSTPPVGEEYSHDEMFDAVSEFDEIGLKNKMMEDDSKIAFLMIGIGEADKQREEEQQGVVAAKEQGNITNVGEEDEKTEIDEEAEGYTEQREQDSGLKARVSGIKDKVSARLSSLVDGAREKITKMRGGDSSEVSDIDLSSGIDSTSGKIDFEQKEDKDKNSSKDSLDRESSKSPKNETINTFQSILKNVWQRASKILREIYLFIKKDLLAIEDQGIFLKGRQRKMNYRVLAAVIVIAVIVLFGAIQIRQDAIKDARVQKENEELVEEIETKLQEISSSTVFTIDTADNVSARERVYAEIVDLENKIETTEIAKDYEQRISESKEELDRLERKLMRIVESEPELLSDLGAVFEGAQGSDITVANGRVFVSDSARNAIYEIDKNGGEEVFFDEDLDNPSFISGDPDGDLLVLDNSTTALGLLDLSSGDLARFPGMSQDKFANCIEMDTYQVADNDIRAYFAMSTSPQVLQVNKNGSAYSGIPQSRWDTEDLAGLEDLSLLDGKFIFIKAGEGIVRYFVDSKITTDVTGLINGDNINSASAVATDALYIYVADPANRRVLVFDKARGENIDYVDLIAQFKYEEGFSDIKDIMVDSENIYVLDGSKVYKLAKNDFQSFTY